MFVEIYFLNNFAADAFLLYLTSVFGRGKIGAKRVALCAFFGAVLSLAYPYVGKLIVPYKIAVLLLTVAGLKKYDGAREYFLSALIFFGVSSLTAGAMLALECMDVGFDYGAVSLTPKPFLFFSSALIVAYLCAQLRASVRFEAKIAPVAVVCTVLNNGATITARAVWDSGNGLTEPFTAKPVVILSRDLAKKLRLTPDGEITATTVTSSGKLETADVESIEVDGQRFESVRVAVSPKNFEGYKIILNCALKEAA